MKGIVNILKSNRRVDDSLNNILDIFIKDIFKPPFAY